MPKAVQDSVHKLNFPRTHRLVSKHDFQSVFAKPAKTTRNYLIALYKPNQQSYARLGVIIGKRHYKRAVDRNQLRRIIRESFRHQHEAIKGLDIIVMLRSRTDIKNKKAIRDNIDTLWPSLVTP